MASLLKLPAELRVQIYTHLMPEPGQYPSAYSGLRNSCRLIREEYDHEAEKVIPGIYDNSPLHLSDMWTIRHKPSDPKTMADISTVEMLPTPFVVNRMARFPRKIIPWHWTWIKTLIISFDMSWNSSYSNYGDGHIKDPASHLIHSAVRMAFERMDNIIKARTGTTVHRRTFSKDDRRPQKCEIDTFVLRWVNFGRLPSKKLNTPFPVIIPPKAGLESNHDRLWDVTFGFNSDGGFFEATWRRRTPLDAQRDAEDNFMPLPEWLELPSA